MVTHEREAELGHLLLTIVRRILIAPRVGAQLFEEVYSLLRGELGADIFFNCRVDEDRTLRMLCGIGIKDEVKQQVKELDIGFGYCGQAVAAGSAVIADAEYINSDPDAGLLREVGIKAYACHPLISRRGEALGTFTVASSTRDHFTTPELRLLQVVGDCLSLAWDCARVEEDLRNSEEKLKFFVANLPVSLAMFDTEMKYIAASVKWSEYFRLPKDLIGKYHYSVFPEIKQEWKDIHSRCLQGATESCDEELFIRPTGEHEWMRWVVCPWHKSDGEIGGIFIFTEDVTERHSAREQLARNAAEYRSLFEGSAVAHAECSIDDLRLLRVNKRFSELTGYSENELLTMTVLDITQPDDAEETKSVTQLLESEKSVLEVEKRYVRKDGRTIWAHLSATAIRDEKGEPVRLLASATDITRQKHAEESLRESEALHRAIAANLPSGAVFIIDRTLACRLAEGMVLKELGFAPSAIEGKRLVDVFGPELGKACEDNCQAVLDGGTFKIEHSSFRRYFVSQGVPLRANDGEIYAALVVSYDITERKRAEKELAESQSQLATLFDVVPIGLAVAEDPACTSVRFNKAHARDLRHSSGENASLSNSSEQWCFDEVYRDGIKVPREDQPLQRAARGEIVHDKIVVRVDDGSAVEFEAFAAPLFDRKGSLRGSVGAFVDTTERTAREQALKDSEERYKAFLTNSSEGVFRLEFDEPIRLSDPVDEQVEQVFSGRIAGCNTAFARIYRFESKEEIIDKELRDVLVTAGEEARASVQLVVDSKYSVVEGERKITDHRGKEYYYSLSVFGVIEEEQVRRVWGTVRDITARKRAEEALKRKEAEFRALADNITQLAWMADESGYIFWYNQRWFDYTGTDLEEMKGWGWREVHHPDFVEAVVEKYNSHIREGLLWEDIFPLRSKEGEFRWFLSRAVPFREEEGGPVRWFGTNTDITEQREVERELRENEERLRLALKAGRTGVWDLDIPEGKVAWSEETCEVFGVDEKGTEVTPEQFFSFIHLDDRERVREVVSTALESADSYSAEFRIVRPDGEVRWISDLGLIRRDSQGVAVSMIGTLTDRTDEKLATEGLKEADRRKDEFLATLAHELRNPLAPLRTGLEVLRQAPRESEMALRAQQMMERQLVHMVRLIDDLLDVSRISRGKIELKREVVSIQSILESAIEASRSTIEAAQHRLDLDIPSTPILLDGDPTRLAQVVSNLLNNAAKYTLEGGKITVKVSGRGERVVISISDTGVGITEEMLPLVFDMFTQVGKTIDRAQGGLGIGLSIVKSLVALHGGTIRAESAGAGKGSTFTVELPCLSQPARLEEATPETFQPKGSAPLKILIVDDNVDGAESLSMLLQLSGHTTRVAHNGPDALSAADEFKPRAVFLDIGLPGMNGHEVAKILRTKEEAQSLTLVALTGWGTEEDKQRSKDAGFDYHLTKPIDFQEVEAVMAELDNDRE